MSCTRAFRLSILALALASAACVQADLEGHACPCVDGYHCVDDVCVKGAADPDDQDCPAQFLPSAACSDAPPASATLVAVCDDGESYPDALLQELGAGAGTCTGAPATATLTGHTLTSSFTYANDRITLTMSGHTTWQYDIPESCTIGGSCFPSENTGDCGREGDGCRCTDIELAATNDNLDAINGNYVGTNAYFGCFVGERFVLREDGGLGLGAILVFEANE